MFTSSVKRLFLLVWVAAFVALPRLASAQDATITGTVTDTTGGVLPGVSITVVNEASGITFESVTDERGRRLSHAVAHRVTETGIFLRRPGPCGPGVTIVAIDAAWSPE